MEIRKYQDILGVVCTEAIVAIFYYLVILYTLVEGRLGLSSKTNRDY